MFWEILTALTAGIGVTFAAGTGGPGLVPATGRPGKRLGLAVLEAFALVGALGPPLGTAGRSVDLLPGCPTAAWSRLGY